MCIFGQLELFALFVPGNVCVYSALSATPPTFPLTPGVCVCACTLVCSRCLMLPCLSPQGYDNTESSVRKASVFCLVAIYSVIGEDLKPHLAQLTGSKVPTVPSLYVLTHTLLPQTQSLIVFPCCYF